MFILIECPCCNGTGKVLQSVCPFCMGRKSVRLDRYLKTIGHMEELHNVRNFCKRTANRMKHRRRSLAA
jgi:DnaJ-class molecular chaperone